VLQVGSVGCCIGGRGRGRGEGKVRVVRWWGTRRARRKRRSGGGKGAEEEGEEQTHETQTLSVKMSYNYCTVTLECLLSV
jgi:hypothetical protein